MNIIFGGSFDPPHNAHADMIRQLSYRKDVDRIIVVPAFSAPHKKESHAPYYCRLNMAKLAFLNLDKVEISDIESKLAGKSYTYNTIKALNLNRPALLIGADMAESFNLWYKADKIIKLVKILVFKRNNRLNTGALDALNADYEVIDYAPSGISSTDIRNNNGNGEICSEVCDYIKSHSLYNTDEEYKKILKNNLTEKRYEHCLNVANEAARLAEKYGADKLLCYTAGLLHDITKDLDTDEQLKLMSEFDIILSDLEKNAIKLWHAITGAFYVREKIGIKNEDIFNSIRYHTTGKKNMTLTEKIIYLADYTSKDRDYNGVGEMRKAVDKDLNTAMKIATKFTVDDLSSRGIAIHPDSLDAFYEYN